MLNEEIKELGEVKPVIVIGGKTGKFVPNMNMSFHGDEFFINLNREDKIITDETAEIQDYKTVLGGNDSDIFHVNENGEFKWDISLKEKPESNIFKWKLKSKGVEFFYQPELTPEEIADGCIRPEEAIGSYAVYCNKANNKYKTGKVCHIYRPFCYDANGLNVYADLKIENGYLTITIPQEYLDIAVWPVCLDPTIGFSNAPASTTSITNIFFIALSGMSTQATSSGTCNKLYFYKGSGSSGVIEVGAYDSASPKNLIEKATQTNNFTENAYNELAVEEFSILSGSNYYLAVGAVGLIYVGFDSTAGNTSFSDGSTSGILPSTVGGSATRTYLMPAYLEYTESSGAVEGSLVGQSPLVGGGVLCGQGNLIN